MSNEVEPAAEPAADAKPSRPGAKLRRRPAMFVLFFVLFCAVMLAYQIVAPTFSTSRLDEYAKLIPRFSDFAIVIDVDAIRNSPSYERLGETFQRQLALSPTQLADAGIELGEGNQLQRIVFAGKSQNQNVLISFFFDKPVNFTDAAYTWLVRQEFRGYDIWVRRPPDSPIWYFADRSTGLLLVSDNYKLVTETIDRREKGAAFRLYEDVAQWTSLLRGDGPVWGAFSELRARRGESDSNGRTLCGLVAAPPRRVPIAGGAAEMALGDDLRIHETLVFKTESQAREYVEERGGAAASLPEGGPIASSKVGDRLLFVQQMSQDGTTVAVEQSLPLDALEELLVGWPASESIYRLYTR
ncbi:MAG: hypothetical protein KDA63_16875 [Planctomycetales bacterium]|nr:hypothetical protein [Planctomycetales bacterium]